MTRERPPRLQLPVEPLAPEAWARIESSLFGAAASDVSGADPTAPGDLHAGSQDVRSEAATPVSRPWRAFRRRPAAWVATAAAAAALIVTATVARRAAAPATIEPPRVSARTGRVRTFTEFTKVVVDGAAVEMAPHTTVSAPILVAHGPTVVVEDGSAAFSVPPRRGRAPFRVGAGRFVVEVVGTRFTVARRGGRVTVAVEHGVVRVFDGDDDVSVLSAGAQWSREESGDEAALDHVPAWLATPSPSHARGRGVGDAAGEAGGAGEGWASSFSSERTVHAPARMDGAPGAPSSTSAAGPSVQAPSVQSPSVQSPSVQSPSVQARFERAAALEPTAPSEALRLYRRIAREPTSWAPNALYAAARLELELGRTAAARASLRRYLSRYGRSPNARDAAELLRTIEPGGRP